MSDLYDPRNPWASYLINAINAKELQKKDVSYIVRGDQVCFFLASHHGGLAMHKTCLVHGLECDSIATWHMVNAINAEELRKKTMSYIVRPGVCVFCTRLIEVWSLDAVLRAPRECTRLCEGWSTLAGFWMLPSPRLTHQVLQVVIVDEFTGRTMADRLWGEGLHQAKELPAAKLFGWQAL